MTTVELFKDIGLTKSMKKTMEFTTKEAQTTWFSSKIAKTVTNVAFNKLQNKLKLPMDYGEALAYTYVRFKNLDKSGRIYYYFIDSVALVDDSTVSFQLAVDPIQTFMTEWSLDTCMVNRKHCDRWGISDYPIRENSNIEGIQATYEAYSTKEISEKKSTKNVRVGAVIFTCTESNSRFVTYMVPVAFGIGFSLTRIEINNAIYSVPSITNCYNNQIFTRFDIDPESVVSMIYLPFIPYECSLNYALISAADTYTWVFPPGTRYKTKEENTLKYAIVDITDRVEESGVVQAVEDFVTTLTVTRPRRPSDGDIYSPSYEPALFKEPYFIRRIVSSDGAYNIDIPDVIINKDESVFYQRSLISPSQQVIISSFNVSADNNKIMAGARECGFVTSIIPLAFDVRNNAWLTYSLTQREADHAIVNNNNMQNAISNLLFMGYGGALVGSRGGGLVKKDIPIRDNIAGIPSNQQPILGYRAGLNPALGGAVGLAAGASIVTSLIDSHFAWENQKLQERKIQNKAQQITISGNNAYKSAVSGLCTPVFVELKCDQVNFDKAAANFWYYGYEINEWQLPDIKSRKYFDYIMTNGAVIKGSIPQDMKEQIAAIFDNGITLFHSDYCTDLEYPAYENIERGLL